ncbi:MAG TPA: DOMON domain-containing protein [Candidatus Sabulitectum sp.]|nr:DOMON domain-containing protein [Candidatus Sabulitectum sp.]HRW78491.1 DOMON domain-containing protein [Candidatus Sabulitectum sp.]
MEGRSGNLPLAILVAAAVIGCGSEASGEATPVATETGKEIVVDDFVLAWTIEDGSMTMTAQAPTTGWVAVGFEPTAAMKDADIIIGYVEDGTLFLRDDFGDGHISHSPDTELGGTDDVTGISGTEEGQITSISFSIPLDSGDGYDRQLTPGSTVKVILAYGPDGADDFEGYHAWAETVEVEL